MTDFRNFFAGEGGGVGKLEEGGLNICKIVYWEKRGGCPTLRVRERISYAVPFSECQLRGF